MLNLSLFLGLVVFCFQALHAQLYLPNDVPSLISAITSSNSNGQNDIIDLGGMTFTLTLTAEQNEWGAMGLPTIKENYYSLTIKNGIIERDTNAMPFRFLHVQPSATLSLQEVTFRNGLAQTNDSNGAEGAGGAIVNQGTIASIHNCLFFNNVAIGDINSRSISKWAQGGAIYNGKIIQSITSTRFENNQAIGIDLIPYSSWGNPVARGGAIFSIGSSTSINRIADTFFINNVALGGNTGVNTINASGQGGALFLSYSKINTIENTVFESNIASGGKGVSDNASGSLPAYAVKASPGEGGAIYAHGQTTISSIQNSAFSFNSALGGDGANSIDAPAAFGRGGAIHMEVNSVLSSLRNTIFNNNSAEGGNGANNFLSAAGKGGALSLSGGTIGNIAFNTFSDNQVIGGNSNSASQHDGEGFGGALYVEDSDQYPSSISGISNTTFSRNFATGGDLFLLADGRGQGGAIHVQSATTIKSPIAVISNSTFSQNYAKNFGGAISGAFKATIGTIFSTTITENMAMENLGGGGIFLEDTAKIAKFTSNIVAQNSDGGSVASQDIQIDDMATIANASYNLIGVSLGHSITNGLNFNKVGSGSIPLNPLLGPLQDNGGVNETHALLPGSPAINAGTSSGAFYDQRGSGFLRTLNGKTDIGSFERG